MKNFISFMNGIEIYIISYLRKNGYYEATN